MIHTQFSFYSTINHSNSSAMRIFLVKPSSSVSRRCKTVSKSCLRKRSDQKPIKANKNVSSHLTFLKSCSKKSFIQQKCTLLHAMQFCRECQNKFLCMDKKMIRGKKNAENQDPDGIKVVFKVAAPSIDTSSHIYHECARLSDFLRLLDFLGSDPL